MGSIGACSPRKIFKIRRLELLLMPFLAKNTCNVLVEEDFDSWYMSRL